MTITKKSMFTIQSVLTLILITCILFIKDRFIARDAIITLIAVSLVVQGIYMKSLSNEELKFYISKRAVILGISLAIIAVMSLILFFLY